MGYIIEFFNSFIHFLGFGTPTPEATTEIFDQNLGTEGHVIEKRIKIRKSQLVEENSSLENSSLENKEIGTQVKEKVNKTISKSMELQSLLNYNNEFITAFEQIELILSDPVLLKALTEKRESLTYEIAYWQHFFEMQCSLAAEFPNDFDILNSCSKTKKRIGILIQDLELNDLRISRMKKIISEGFERLDSIKAIFEAEDQRNTLLEKELENFKSEFQLELKKASQIQISNSQHIHSEIFHENLNHFNRRVQLRNEHLVELKDIIQDHFDYVKRVRSRLNIEFYLKEAQTASFKKVILKDMKKLNTKLKFGLQEVLEFEKTRSDYKSTFFASSIWFSKLYYGPQYTDFEITALEAKYKQYCTVDTLGKFFDLAYVDIQNNAKVDKEYTLHSFFVFRSYLLKTVENNLPPKVLYDMLQNSDLCHKNIQNIFDLNKPHIDYFYRTYYSALNPGEAVTDLKLKTFEDKFLKILGQQSMIWLRQYMYQVYGVTDFAWEH